MSDKTGIEWTDATWNPVTGCSKVSQGCKHCYAERDWARLSANPGTKYFGRDFTNVATHAAVLPLPCRWTKPRRIFVNSMSDLFHEAVPFEFIAAVFGVMAGASWHSFQVLTKRPQRMLDFFAWLDAHPLRAAFDSAALHEKYPGDDWRPFLCADLAACVLPDQGEGLRVAIEGKWPLSNVWLGVSVEDQAAADERVPLLLRVPAAVRFVSVEPMLGPVDLERPRPGPDLGQGEGHMICQPWLIQSGIDWVICGGESGPHARPMHPHWARSLRDQCEAAGVPFLFKQWGEWTPEDPGEGPHSDCAGVLPNGETEKYSEGYQAPFDTMERLEKSGGVRLDGRMLMFRVGKKAAGRLLEGIEHNGFPEVRT